MAKKRSLAIFFAIVLVAAEVVAFKLTPMDTSPQQSVTVGSTTVMVDIANTEALRAQGLSGRVSLGSKSGMLFIFDEEGGWGMWMKNMLFAIDIVWLNRDGSINTIAHSVSPDTYPQAFYPTKPTALYVLELPAGFVQQKGLAEGDKIVI